ncbi:MAG: hypothetical protein K0B05_03155 [Bacteroidales bacterium]|nr:hypothetical protein [Bacteroidales bacterium]
MENNAEKRIIEIDQDTLKDLNATRKWTMFLAIIGFILVGFMLIAGLAAGTFLSVFKTEEVNLGIPESLVILLFLVIAAIYFFPVFFLFRFSRHTSRGVSKLDSAEIHKAFKNLRTYFTYIGILAIIVIVIYLAALVFAGTSMSFLNP